MKKLRILLVSVAVIVVLWAGMLITDTVRSNDFREPVFAQPENIQSDDLSCAYRGLGYTVYQRNYADENGNIHPEYSEVKLFGILVSAVIV